MFKVELDPKAVKIETGNAIYEWDASRGGFLSGMTLKDGKELRELMDANLAPDIVLEVNGETKRLSECDSEFSEVYREDDYIIFAATSKIGGVLTFEQQYEVFDRSAVFCEFRIMVDEGAKVKISKGDIHFALNLCGAKNVKSNYMSRDPYLKQDVTVPHILATVNVALDRSEVIDQPHTLPMLGLDLGWNDTRHYSNRVEFILEDTTSIGNEMVGSTSTLSREVDGIWRHDMNIGENIDEEFESPFFYRNKWAIFCGCSRSGSGIDTDPVRRNNVLGARICHTMYPYVYAERNWPWSSVPLKQCFYQDVQIADENPSLDRVDEAIAQGANIMIIHQFWMSCGGSNGEPMASYKPHDPEWMQAYIDKAHEKGMRVLLYARGIEQYMLYMDFFDKYLKKDWDGIYMDWAAPFLMGYAKSSVMHSSVYNWFMFTRALREKVGQKGVLIGHTTMQTSVSYCNFDVALTGEFSVLHTGLLGKPEISTSYTGQSCCGIHLIAGNAPDRRDFSSQKAVGYAAGLGWANHPFMEPGIDFTYSSDFTKPLWDSLRCLDSDPVAILNPSVDPAKFADWSNDSLYPVAYKDDKDNVLVLVTNLGSETLDGEVEINLASLGCESGTLEALDVQGTHKAEIDGNRIILKAIEPYFFCSVMIK